MTHPQPIRSLKRALDLVFTLMALMVLWPLLLLITALVWLLLGSPVYFRQSRPGLAGIPFRLIKFRTMSNTVGKDGRPLSDAERLTGFGRFLRASSLDELPELWNVLMGDMSMVGPRPWLMEYLPHYTLEQMRRHEVRPGITGWAQVNGRNAASWEERLRLDVWYVDHWSFWLDLRILLRTVWTVFRREGISAEGHATMPRFDERPGKGQNETSVTNTEGRNGHPATPEAPAESSKMSGESRGI